MHKLDFSMVLIRCCTEDFQRLKHGYTDINQSRAGHIYSQWSVRAVSVSEGCLYFLLCDLAPSTVCACVYRWILSGGFVLDISFSLFPHWEDFCPVCSWVVVWSFVYVLVRMVRRCLQREVCLGDSHWALRVEVMVDGLQLDVPCYVVPPMPREVFRNYVLHLSSL